MFCFKNLLPGPSGVPKRRPSRACTPPSPPIILIIITLCARSKIIGSVVVKGRQVIRVYLIFSASSMLDVH